MGLFINNKKHPAIFKNQAGLTEPNQAVYKQDYLSELIEKQNQANAELQNSLQSLEKSLIKQNRLFYCSHSFTGILRCTAQLSPK